MELLINRITLTLFSTGEAPGNAYFFPQAIFQ